MHKITKQVDRRLKELADSLPKKEIITRRIKGEELIRTSTKEHLAELGNVNPKGIYIHHQGGEAVNHYKRLRRAFTSNGSDGVAEYIAPYVDKDKVREMAEANRNNKNGDHASTNHLDT